MWANDSLNTKRNLSHSSFTNHTTSNLQAVANALLKNPAKTMVEEGGHGEKRDVQLLCVDFLKSSVYRRLLGPSSRSHGTRQLRNEWVIELIDTKRIPEIGYFNRGGAHTG